MLVWLQVKLEVSFLKRQETAPEEALPPTLQLNTAEVGLALPKLLPEL